MSDYNELISCEVEDLTQKLEALLIQEGKRNLHGIAALLLYAGAILDRTALPKGTPKDALVVKKCLDLLLDHPGAYVMLIGQIGKLIAMIDMGFYDKGAK